MLTIRAALADDSDSIWSIIEPIIRAGDTYPLPQTMNREEGLAYWWSNANELFVADENGDVVGTYYVRANQRGRGSHVANCAYITSISASGRGIARAMCAHSLARAKARSSERCSSISS
jgi:predicted GNAT family acetyltransferase